MTDAIAASANRVEEVRRDIVDAILRGEIRPGEAVPALRIARQYGVAPATAREIMLALHANRLIVVERNHAPRIVVPTPAWFLAVVAEASGLSAICADLGIAQATATQRAFFARECQRVRTSWTDSFEAQGPAVRGIWELFKLLADYSGNADLARFQNEKWPAIALGFLILRIPRNPKMLHMALDGLADAMRVGDRAEGVAIVRDLYDFVIAVRIDV